MGNAVYNNRYHSNYSNNVQNQPSSGATQASTEEYIEDGDLSSESQQPLTRSQKALSDRYQEVRKKIGNTLQEFEGRMKEVISSKSSETEKIASLEEIESLLSEIEKQKSLYDALEDNLERHGLPVDDNDLDLIINKYQNNIDGFQSELAEKRAEIEAIEKEKAEQEAAKAAREAEIKERKEKTTQTLNSLVGHVNGSISPVYKGNKKDNAAQAESILRLIANGIESDDWGPLSNQLSSLDAKKRGTSAAIAIAIIKNHAPREVQETIPADVYYKLANAIQGSHKPHKKRVKIIGGGKTGTNNSGYAAQANELAGISNAYQKKIENSENATSKEKKE
ncbi:MAG: hypothetical protein H7A32_01155 [Deltaproteobacteria bacterium]|nr:hypothetical protein [Deltaproteobacteria bacterium]